MLRNTYTIDQANEYFRNDIDYYVSFFQKYLQYAHNFFLERAIYKYYITYDQYPSSILDIGCGTGDAVLYLAERIPDAKIIGIDPSISMLSKLALIKNKAVKIFCTDLNKFDNQFSFDLILSYSNFRFWTHPIEEIAKINTLLSKNGLFYLLDLRKDTCPKLLNELIKGLNAKDRQFMRTQFSAAYSLDEALEIAKKSQIQNVKVTAGIPELYEDNEEKFFANLENNETMAKSLFDLSKGFNNRKGAETVYSISLLSKTNI